MDENTMRILIGLTEAIKDQTAAIRWQTEAIRIQNDIAREANRLRIETNELVSAPMAVRPSPPNFIDQLLAASPEAIMKMGPDGKLHEITREQFVRDIKSLYHEPPEDDPRLPPDKTD